MSLSILIFISVSFIIMAIIVKLVTDKALEYKKEIKEIKKQEENKPEEKKYTKTINTGYNSLQKNKQKLTYKQKIEKGDLFEKLVSEYYINKGYTIKKNGTKRFKDEGIDIIAKKENKTLLIQCKDWATWKYSEKQFKQFLGSCQAYSKKYNLIEKETKNIFVISKNNITKQGMVFTIENKELFEVKIIPNLKTS